MRSATLFWKKEVIFCLCDIDFGGTSEKKARALLGQTRFFSLSGPEATRIDILSFYVINTESLPVLSHPEELGSHSGGNRVKNRSPNEYVFFWVSAGLK